MHPDEPPVAVTTRTSRRALVRLVAHSAWAVPVVSLAAATPAYAATSGFSPLVIDDAHFYVHDWRDGTFGVVPLITVTNPNSTPAVQVDLLLDFPFTDFEAIDTTTNPPEPGFTRFFGIDTGGWMFGFDDPQPGDNGLLVDLMNLSGLGAGTRATVGTFDTTKPPVSLDWANNPQVNSISLEVFAGFSDGSVSTVVGALTRVDPPTSP